MSEPRVFDAPVATNQQVPAYKVVEVAGPFTREVSMFDEKSKQIVKTPVVNEKGYMVFFPRGHSQMYHSIGALSRAGFSEIVPLINLANEAEVNRDHQPAAVRQPITKG